MSVTASTAPATGGVPPPGPRAKPSGLVLNLRLGRSATTAQGRQRRHRRFPVHCPVIIKWRSDSGQHEAAGICLDLSEGGARVKVDEFVPLCTPVHLRLPDLQAEAEGEVRQTDDHSIGIEFTDLTYYGPHKGPRPAGPPKDPEKRVIVGLGAALLLAIASGLPGLLPSWVPFAAQPGTPIPLAPASFSLGSTRSEVYAVQGPPTFVTPSAWHYGPARVFFRGNVVSGWLDSTKRVLSTGAGEPRNPTAVRSRFTLGATAGDVLAAQGPPNVLSDDVWKYGMSEVYFRNGRVVGWRAVPKHPLETELPEAGRQPPIQVGTEQSDAPPQSETLTAPLQ